MEFEGVGCDVQDVSRRVEVLTTVLDEVESITDGVVSLDRLVESPVLVEIGLGRGALGRLLRDHGSRSQIIGTDVVYPYQGETAYDAYNKIIPGDIKTNPILMEAIRAYQPECLISIGVPPSVNQFIVANRYNLSLRGHGLIALITDFNMGSAEGFSTFNGTMTINSFIHVFENK